MRKLVIRVNPILFVRRFRSWIAALWPDRHDLMAIAGKTVWRTHDCREELKTLNTLSACAISARLLFAQLSVPEKTNEIADKIVAHKADYVLALKSLPPRRRGVTRHGNSGGTVVRDYSS